MNLFLKILDYDREVWRELARCDTYEQIEKKQTKLWTNSVLLIE